MRHDHAVRTLAARRSTLDSGLPLQQLINKKHNRNNLSVSLPCLGVSKLKRLMSLGISTAAELVESENPHVKPEWKTIVEEHFDKIRAEIDDLQETKHKLLSRPLYM